MAVKKSELYSSIWSSCDTLRGSMDASQYKDYVLALLFIKYISDKYADLPFPPIKIPKGASFKDMVALKGKSDIGDQINKKIIAPLFQANKQLSQADFPDFNDPNKLGDDKEKVERLTKLIAIFERKEFNFANNRADGDDILGDVYEYLMCNFAVQSGKSKGQFYTPAEVSRTIAQVLGIRAARTTPDTTIYDPTCGSGSLLLRVADEARTAVTINGQERDATTCGLARMNMILHNHPEAFIAQGNTLTSPKFKNGEELQMFDYVVANPPFSDKEWSNGFDPANDTFDRFNSFGIPPTKQGDYAYLLHIVRSLKSTGRGACILPHGVLFRGNAEAEIRRNLVNKKYIKGIIGLPPNLFFGTGIPACIIVLDKKEAHARTGIFMIDASAGFMKDGPKNRLRARDIHKMVDAFNKEVEIPKFSRMVSFEEIEKNDFNLNLPRYINSQQEEDIQDIDGHLRGGIPLRDIDALQGYWDICPKLRKGLFKESRKSYFNLVVEKAAIKTTIYDHPEFSAFITEMNAHFIVWQKKQTEALRKLKTDMRPKEVIVKLAEDILAHYTDKPLMDKYAVYQHVMDYWGTVMQDDCYLIAADGWKAETYRVIEVDKKGKEKDKGWTCDLVPKALIVDAYFAKEQDAIKELTAQMETASARMAEIEEEQSGDEGFFADFDKVNKASIAARANEIKTDKAAKEERAVLDEWLKLAETESDLKKQIKDAESDLDAKAYAKYTKLTETEVKTLVVDHKWLAALDKTVHGELERISQALTQRVKELAERYDTPMPILTEQVDAIEAKVNQHLKKMGFSS
ncbi:MAG: type I restriction-modification system subunit M [Bdellovibrionales bacterium]